MIQHPIHHSAKLRTKGGSTLTSRGLVSARGRAGAVQCPRHRL